MRIAIIGSRNIYVPNIGDYVARCDEIVSGGARGVDACAAEYAKQHGVKLTVFLPQYERYGRAAPILRNKQIVEYADRVIAFWDGNSKGTLSVIRFAQKTGKECTVILCESAAPGEEGGTAKP